MSVTTTSWVVPGTTGLEVVAGAAWLEELVGVLFGSGALEGVDVDDGITVELS